MRDYRNRLVALLDVLGASVALTNPESARRFAEAVARILSPIVRHREEPALALPHVTTGEEIEINMSPVYSRGAGVTSISDSVVVSVPYGARLSPVQQMRRILECLQCVFWLQRGLLLLGLRTRGGIAVGGVIHNANIVIGEGLVRAHHLEKQVANFPRVVIDDAIIDTLVTGPLPDTVLFQNRIASMIRQDGDGRYFVDYLSDDPMAGACGLQLRPLWRTFTEEAATCSDPRISQKLDWLLTYLMATVEFYENRHEPFTGHAEPRFTARYTRTPDNFVTWAKAEYGDDFLTRHRQPADSRTNG